MPLVQQVIADEIHKVRKQVKFNKHQISSVMEILKKFDTKVSYSFKIVLAMWPASQKNEKIEDFCICNKEHFE